MAQSSVGVLPTSLRMTKEIKGKPVTFQGPKTFTTPDFYTVNLQHGIEPNNVNNSCH